MEQQALNKYRIMLLLVLFDLPTKTDTDKKIHAGFRKALLEDGFDMMQYSVYIRHCPSKEYADLHMRRINKFSPRTGKISVIRITEKQYSDMVNIWGHGKKEPTVQKWEQALLF